MSSYISQFLDFIMIKGVYRIYAQYYFEMSHSPLFPSIQLRIRIYHSAWSLKLRIVIYKIWSLTENRVIQTEPN